jgi:hypothetical protein
MSELRLILSAINSLENEGKGSAVTEHLSKVIIRAIMLREELNQCQCKACHAKGTESHI